MSSPLTSAAITVTYEPDAGWPERLYAILNICPRCLVVDNSVTPEARAFVRATVAGLATAELIANPANLGLAAALNTGFAALEQRGFSEVIAFDQDSAPGPGFGHNLTNLAGNGSPAVVGANWRDEARPDQPSLHLQPNRSIPFFFQRVAAERDLPAVTCVITSGTLFQLSAWRKLGGFDEKLFLDLVDTDYCLRAAAAGMAVCVSASARLLHQRGAKRPVRLAGRTWWPAFMPPARLHGLFRNRLLLFRRHGWRNPHWVAFELTYTMKIFGEIIFLEDRKWSKLSACVRGLWDGLLGRSGPIVNTPR